MTHDRVPVNELPRSVIEALANLKVEMAIAMPDVEHAQITFDHLHDESPPTVDVIR